MASDAASSPSMETGMNVMHESKVSCSTTGLNFGRSVSSGMCAPYACARLPLCCCVPAIIHNWCLLGNSYATRRGAAIIPDQERDESHREGRVCVCVCGRASIKGGPASRSRCKNADVAERSDPLERWVSRGSTLPLIVRRTLSLRSRNTRLICATDFRGNVFAHNPPC